MKSMYNPLVLRTSSMEYELWAETQITAEDLKAQNDLQRSNSCRNIQGGYKDKCKDIMIKISRIQVSLGAFVSEWND